MTRRAARFVLALLAVPCLATLLASEACLAPTQVTVVIDTDVPCVELAGVSITTAGHPEDAESKTFVQAETSACESSGRVGTLVVTPAADGSGRVAILVAAGVTRPVRDCTAANMYEGCIVARRLITFIDHTPLTVPITLQVDCLDVPCNAISTCSDGRCISSETACENGDCSRVGVAEDGSVVIVEDAPTSNDAGGPSADRCALHDVPTPCPLYTNSGACPPGTACCVYGSTGPYANSETDAGLLCNDVLTCSTTSLGCGGAENCPAGQICCLATPTQTTCLAPGGCNGPRACVDDCECPGQRCALGGEGRPAFVKTCQ
jgi:hypothetical protein